MSVDSNSTQKRGFHISMWKLVDSKPNVRNSRVFQDKAFFLGRPSGRCISYFWSVETVEVHQLSIFINAIGITTSQLFHPNTFHSYPPWNQHIPSQGPFEDKLCVFPVWLDTGMSMVLSNWIIPSV